MSKRPEVVEKIVSALAHNQYAPDRCSYPLTYGDARALHVYLCELESEIKGDDCTIEDLNHQIAGFKAEVARLEKLVPRRDVVTVVRDLAPAMHESAIRNALINLGWTPPPVKGAAVNDPADDTEEDLGGLTGAELSGCGS